MRSLGIKITCAEYNPTEILELKYREKQRNDNLKSQYYDYFCFVCIVY